MIAGDVQGVFFRAGVQDQARRLAISGWARNTPDGNVEVMAEGARDALEKLLEWCRHGPAGASVSEVKHEWFPPSGNYQGFRIRYD